MLNIHHFGRRAGSTMVTAVVQGVFNLARDDFA